MRPMLARPAWLLPLLVFAAAAAAQLPALGAPAIWDDVPLLVQSDLYTSPARWVEAVGAPLAKETYYWRPLATTTLLLDTQLVGSSLPAHRVVATLLHAGVATLAFALLARLLASRGAAFLAALAWALHPVTIETATWVSARFDLCAALFSLAALLCVPREGAVSGVHMVLLAIATAAACLSKENAFTLPVVAGAWAAALHRVRVADLFRAGGRVAWSAGAAAAAGVAVVLFARYETLGYLFVARDTTVAEAGTPLQHALLIGRAVATYLHMLVAPWGAVGPAHHAPRPVPPDDALGWTGLALAPVLVAVTVWALRRRPTVGWLLVVFLVLLLPVSQIVPVDLAGGLHAADRFLYLPAFFAVAAVADLAVAAVRAGGALRARVATIAAAALVAALLAGRLWVLPRWNSPVRFWTWVVEMAPRSDLTRGNLAFALIEEGRFAEAEAQAQRPGAEDFLALATALRAQGRFTEAVRALDTVLRQPDHETEAVQMRGEMHLALGQPKEAFQDFEAVIAAERDAKLRFAPLRVTAMAAGAEALASMPDRALAARARAAETERIAPARDPRPWEHLARAYLLLRDVAGFERTWANARAAGAERIVLARLRADAFAAAGNHAEAAKAYELILAVRPDDDEVLALLAGARFELGDLAASEKALRRAVAIAPSSPWRAQSLALVLRRGGRAAEARAEFERALALARGQGLGELEAAIRADMGGE